MPQGATGPQAAAETDFELAASENVRSEAKGAHDSSGQDDEDLPQRAQILFNRGNFGECLLALEAASARGQLSDTRQRLVVQMHIAARNKDWWKVLQLPARSEEKAIKASYKRLAQRVHPDKCSCFGAEQAFKILSEAVGQIIGSSEGGFVKDSGAEQHVWWEAWDMDADTAKRKRKREPEPVQQTEEEALNLRQCSIEIDEPVQELRKEVANRQKAVLRPAKGTPDEKLTPAQRQQRVRVARALLSERLSYAQNAPQRQGGFL